MSDKSSLSKYYLVYSNEQSSDDWPELKFYGLFPSIEQAKFYIQDQYRPSYDRYLKAHQKQVDRAKALGELTKVQRELLGLYDYPVHEPQDFEHWLRTSQYYKIEAIEVIDDPISGEEV